MSAYQIDPDTSHDTDATVSTPTIRAFSELSQMYSHELSDPDFHISWFIIVQGGNRRVTGMYRGDFALSLPCVALR